MKSITPEQVWASRSIVAELEARGVKVLGQSNQRNARCPFHDDKNPSFSINVEKNAWHCHGGCGKGSVVDLIALFEQRDSDSVYADLAKEVESNHGQATFESEPVVVANGAKPRIVKIYSYEDANGVEVYQVVRMEPKTFRQRHMGADGKWIWDMEGVTRVLYRLPQVQAAPEIWQVEGEKDAETLVALGFEATCNVGGAGKWLDSYTETLLEKDVVLCGDNDKPGKEHMVKVLESLSGKVKTVRVVSVPSPFKDITDYLATFGAEMEQARKAVNELRERARVLKRGIDLPLFTMQEIEERYRKFMELSQKVPVDLGLWLPSFRQDCRPLVPGDLVVILAGTGVGKTAIIQNLARAWAHIPVVIFELELAEEAMFERVLGERAGFTGEQVEGFYRKGHKLGDEELEAGFGNLLLCTVPRLTVQQMETLCQKAELKLGQSPRVVMIDYLQLAEDDEDSDGRYAKYSNIAEAARGMAKVLKAVVIVTSQIKRKGEDADAQVTMHDGKESGSIENSSSLLLGAWREADDGGGKMCIRVLKNTRGKSGRVIECNWSPTLRITERVINHQSNEESYQTHP